MDNNQNERKNINLSREGVREAYPVYSSDPSQAELQRQEYRNQTDAPFMEPENDFNIPQAKPAEQNNFDHYYDYNDPQSSIKINQQSGYSGSYATNQPAGGGYRPIPQPQPVTQNPPQPIPPSFNQPNPAYGVNPNQNRAFAQPTVKFCKFCGKQIANDAVVCTHCGRQVEGLNGAGSPVGNGNINIYNAPVVPPNIPYGMTNVSQKSKTTAIILALLGFCCVGGLHRLYSGKLVSGLLYLFTGGLFGIGTIYDIYKLATNTFTDGAGYIIKND